MLRNKMSSKKNSIYPKIVQKSNYHVTKKCQYLVQWFLTRGKFTLGGTFYLPWGYIY